MSRSMLLLILLGILLLNCQETLGRRGRGRSRSKSRVQIGLPITGKYRDPESDQYYNNNNVCKIEECLKEESLKSLSHLFITHFSNAK